MDNKNMLLEEEIEIIEAFNYEIGQFGYKGYCSFSDNVENGYFIYKEDNNWIVDFNKKGNRVSERRYTNIYNLCIDILKELKIAHHYFIRRDFKIPRGTIVVISKTTDCVIDEVNKGIIIGSSISRLGNAEPERIYQVLGDDGEVYNGLYGLNIYGDVSFRTMEDFIEYLKGQIEENKESIQQLCETNWDLYLTLSDVINQKEKYLDGYNRLKIR